MRSLSNLSAVALGFALLGVACGAGDRGESARDETAVATAPAVASRPAADAADVRPRLVILGDSLTAGLGLPAPASQAYPAQLQQRLDQAGLHYNVVNAGVSGDTSAGGLARLDWALEGDVRVLVVALGGNDGLRGLPAEELSRNLSAIIERAQAKHIKVILAGMEAPPNYGRAYIVSFHQVYPALARKYQVAFLPFLLEGVAGVADLNQPDGIHPTAQGARLVADNVWAVLKPMVEARGTHD